MVFMNKLYEYIAPKNMDIIADKTIPPHKMMPNIFVHFLPSFFINFKLLIVTKIVSKTAIGNTIIKNTYVSSLMDEMRLLIDWWYP